VKKKILILGGSSDIGLEVAKNFLNSKTYDLTLHHHSNSRIFKNLKLRCNFIKSDLSNSNHSKILKKFDNDYDIIINLVGYISNQSFEKFNIREFYKTISANTLVPILIIRKSLNKMKKKNYGRIINTSSIGVKFGGGKTTYLYSLSKHMNEFIPAYLKKMSDRNILYNCLRIGVVNTKLHKKIKKKDLIKRVNLIPTKKMATAKEISDFIFYLINKNNFINNEVINISGGE
jgi:short-subunit dehydrogenase